MLNDDQLLRYSRQLMVEEFDLAGQEVLAGARVLVVGCGGLANPAALYLAGAGVGELVLADDDAVELSNLHRQGAFRGKDVGQSKAEALKAELQALNSDVSVQAHTVRVDADWLDREVASATVVLDCTDNFATRQSINQACVTHRTPLVSGAAIRMDGQLAVFDLRQPDSACYACVYGDGTDGDLACSQAGIVGPVVGVVGTLQALAAMQVLLGNPMPATLRLFDGRTLSWREMRFHKDPACPVCSRR
ncbi:molybdopterin-synthase adenylyltransferase MoeB [uncultured Alcanivorax sp.]|uniref:HesA/MoeB/ThiF family protein n=1 Tax=uncultured Alcanivorax sp. TaxID=191215 RepID=UPI00261C8DE4|nr:molybdopterin-synthase adenylyltransferase MoeB [uncultured Alcanivorax sp.]